MTLFQDGICYDCDIAWCFWENASWDTIRSSSGYVIDEFRVICFIFKDGVEF